MLSLTATGRYCVFKLCVPAHPSRERLVWTHVYYSLRYVARAAWQVQAPALRRAGRWHAALSLRDK